MEYLNLVQLYQKLEETTKRLEKTYLLSEFLKTTKKEDIAHIVLLLQGKLFPSWDERKIGVASRLILKAINISTGITIEKIEQEWKKTGDLGLVAENLVTRKKQVTLFSHQLSTQKVFNNLRKLAGLEGAGTVDKKLQLIAELLTSSKPLEAKYIIRTLLEELRVGVGEGSLRDAIVWASFGDKIGLKYLSENKIDISSREEYNHYAAIVQRAYDLTNDFSSVAEAAKLGLKELEEIELAVFRPLKVMLALKVKDIKEGFERCGKPADIEYKLDGFRIQVHKQGNKIKLFTRRLEEVTLQFPEVVEYVKKNVKGDSFILDSEAAGFNPKTGKYFPFQHISQRIRRKYDIEEMSNKFPVELNVFDILYYNGKNLIKEDFQKRRELIEKLITNKPKKIQVVTNLITEDEKKVEKFYKDSLSAGNEGIMFKKLDSPYKPGARVGHMVKMKPVMETLDLVIVGAEWGTGKRANWLSSFTLACIDEDGNFLEIGKMGTGIKEKSEEGTSFEQLTDELKPLILSEKGREVKLKPKVVIEVNYEEIQKSPNYSSGYALRFPRMINLRLDRHPSECSTITLVEDLYYGQKKK
ncbi:MAG: ATP-dependent DNA ligase [Nanoarchaeota archaeon]|nr:ATP-dependent DNA ligase [Nanoarchaeota archaeon]MBU1004599.1 ATP-dependent DNA ligase [Nanoarchaeota archaeon]MBU1946493.1 ATP-dependent DNA ligase [Nanoarchaeota archaeon]